MMNTPLTKNKKSALFDNAREHENWELFWIFQVSILQSLLVFDSLFALLWSVCFQGEGSKKLSPEITPGGSSSSSPGLSSARRKRDSKRSTKARWALVPDPVGGICFAEGPAKKLRVVARRTEMAQGQRSIVSHATKNGKVQFYCS